jgi:hypothetical protein
VAFLFVWNFICWNFICWNFICLELYLFVILFVWNFICVIKLLFVHF